MRARAQSSLAAFDPATSRAIIPKAEDRATAIPTAAEVLFRLEHFLVFE